MLAVIILCMLISPVLSIPLLCIGIYQSRNTISKWYAVPFALLYGIFGYNYYFIGQPDLFRYFIIVDSLRGQSLWDILQKDTQRLYTKDILFYFVSKTENNYILPFIVGFVCYLIIFYVFFDVVNRCKLVFKTKCGTHIFMIGLTMVSITPPTGVISNVRCVFAFLLISFAAYREWVQKKKNFFTLLLYIIAIGMHTSAVLLVIIRILTPFLKRFKEMLIGVAVLFPTIITFIYKGIKINDTNILGRAIEKMWFYLNWTEGGWADEIENSISNKLTRIYGTFFLILVILLYRECKKRNYILVNENMHDYLFIVVVLSLGSLYIKTGVFWRLEAVVVFFCPLILMPIAMNASKHYMYILYTLYVSACMMFILQVIRISRGTVMQKVITGYISTSTLKIIGEILHGVISMFEG